MLLPIGATQLFAKLHDAHITRLTLRISIGYQCMAESTTRLLSSVKPSNCNNFRILLVYSRHTDSRAFWGHLRQTYCQHSLHRQTLLEFAARRFSCCTRIVWNSLPSFVHTADSFTSFRSQLKTYMFARHLYRASDTLMSVMSVFRALYIRYVLTHKTS